MTILEHFRKEEHPFVEQVNEWKQIVEERYESRLTNFLDPREQDILSTVIGYDDVVKYEFWGGVEQAERKRALIYPFYEEAEWDRFDLVLFELDYPAKFVTLRHRDILGALMGLGIKREKFGDILQKGSDIQFITSRDIADFVEVQFTQAGKAPVKLKQRSFDEALRIEERWEERFSTVSSLRLDVLIAEMYRLSRSKVIPYIDRNRVKVNWKTVDNPSYPIQSGDTLSVKGLGRRKLLDIDGQSKKGKWRILYGIKNEQDGLS